MDILFLDKIWASIGTWKRPQTNQVLDKNGGICTQFKEHCPFVILNVIVN